jgi:hypothetical protein
MANHWLAQTLEDKESRSLEISVVRSDYTDGRGHFGGFGEQKLMVFRDGGHAVETLDPNVKTRLQSVAETTALELNLKEKVSNPIDLGPLADALSELAEGIGNNTILSDAAGVVGDFISGLFDNMDL